jgi:outer membrane protein assembly factor BamB
MWGVLVLATLVTGLARAEQSQEKLVSAEYEGRKVIMPADLPLDLDWYSPVVDPVASGLIVRGWAAKDLILLETDQNYLIAVRRSDGTERWRMKMLGPLMFEPVVTSHNVFACVKNYLTAIEKRSGEERWRILPKFPMSSAPYVAEPPMYPNKYTKDFIPLEHIFTGTWNNYIQCFQVRGRLYDYVRSKQNEPVLQAPQYDLLYLWQKSLRLEKSLVLQPPIMMDDTVYYASDDKRIRGISRDGEERESFLMQGEPSTNMRLSSNTLYIGARDCYFYALDRLTLRRKWIYAPGVVSTGTIYSDEAPEKPLYVFPTTVDKAVHALEVIPAKPATKTSIAEPESHKLLWKLNDAEGVVTAGERKVYLGAGVTDKFRGYKKVCAVLKDSGKVEWASESQGVRFYIEFHNQWSREDQEMRLFAVTEDNRLLSLKERAEKVGPVVAKVEEKKEPAKVEPVKP